jgi:hypothetical protein
MILFRDRFDGEKDVGKKAMLQNIVRSMLLFMSHFSTVG